MGRKIKNFLIEKNFQLRIGFIFAAFATCLGAFFIYGISATVLAIKENIQILEQSDSQLFNMINHYLSNILLLGWVTIVIIYLSTFVYAVVVNHRVAGPRYVLKNFIIELQKGNYDARLTLRKNDELRDLMDELQILRENLKKNKN